MSKKVKKLKAFFNAKARESAVAQLLRAAWLAPGLVAYMNAIRPIIAISICAVIWLIMQIAAHWILSLQEKWVEVKPEKPTPKSETKLLASTPVEQLNQSQSAATFVEKS